MSYKSARKEIAEQNDAQPTCAFCGRASAWETLSSYGSRCGACYAAYCSAYRPFPAIGDKSTSPRSWADALKARHEAGDRLTPAQITAYKTVIGMRHEPETSYD
jgi:ribosomal protein L37AE/L43A